MVDLRKSMNNQKRISVIIPIYNTAAWMLEECLNSVFEQTVPVNSIILVDDGSTNDETLDFEEKYRTYERVILLKKEHSGISDSRNHGLKKCEDDYLFFLDSDDKIENTFVEKISQPLVNQEYDIIISGGHFFENQNGTKTNFYPSEDVLEDINRYPYALLVAAPKLFRKDFLSAIGCDFPVGCINEDATFSMMSSMYAKNICSVSYYGYCVRMNPNSTCRSRRTFNIATLDNISFGYYKRILLNRPSVEAYQRTVVEYQLLNTIMCSCSIFACYSTKEERKKLVEKSIEFINSNFDKKISFIEMNKRFKTSSIYLFATIIFFKLCLSNKLATKIYLQLIIMITRLSYKMKGID